MQRDNLQERAMAKDEETSNIEAAGGPLGKPLKTETEFATVIAKRIRVSVKSVKIHKGGPFGWRPQVTGPLGRLPRYQQAAEEAASELRGEYDLAG
jgi:hypothetical protein